MASAPASLPSGASTSQAEKLYTSISSAASATVISSSPSARRAEAWLSQLDPVSLFEPLGEIVEPLPHTRGWMRGLLGPDDLVIDPEFATAGPARLACHGV